MWSRHDVEENMVMTEMLTTYDPDVKTKTKFASSKCLFVPSSSFFKKSHFFSVQNGSNFMVKSCNILKENMEPDQTLVCVKQVKQKVADEWDGSMPLPGDIIEGIAEDDNDTDDSFVSVKARSELSSHLGKINPQVEFIWLKVRRGNNTIKLRARIVQQKSSILQRKYTIQAATDPRHIADIGDLTSAQSTELQEMSRKCVNVKSKGFHRSGIKYDWKMKVGKHLPDQCCSVLSSILFMPLEEEHCVHTTTGRCMGWFSAAVSSGVPLVFVNIQTEQIAHSGIRLWYLPGVAEISIELIPRPREVRFGMEIKRTEEGFVCIYSVMGGSAAERAGVRKLCEEAIGSGFLLVISRLDGNSVMPCTVCSAGLIHCCDHSEIKHTLASALDENIRIQMHVMAWPNQTRLSPLQPVGSAALLPPPGFFSSNHYD